MSGARRYQSALRAIRRRLPSATYRDAQGVYRSLRATTLGPIAPRHVASARQGTLQRQLRRARALGTRTTIPTPAQRRAIERAARKFNPGTKEAPDVPKKERQKIYTLAQWETLYQQSSPAEREPIEIETSPDYVREAAPSRRAQGMGYAARKRRTVSETEKAISKELSTLDPEDRAAMENAVDELRALRGHKRRRRRRSSK